jgi:signal transduction histidine kinase
MNLLDGLCRDDLAMPGTEAPRAAILAVDDDAKTLVALRELLAGDGQSIVVAASGEEALRCVLKQDFAVILLDARMPGVDGFETARMIRERERSRHTPILFLTGEYEDLASMFRGYEAGAVDYLVKPLIPEVLKSKISVFVELYNKNAVLLREIAERESAEQRLRASEENLRALAARLQSVREEERSRIAREIHDQLGQALTGLKMDLTWLGKKLPGGSRTLMAKVKSMFRLIDDTIRSVRKIASLLRPEVLDQLGLAAAIGWQAKDFQMRTGIRCRVNLPGETISMEAERSTAVFRVFQELLTNVARHAKATRVEISLRAESSDLVLEVQDNGKGMSEAELQSPRSLGLLGMRERAMLFGGKIEFSSGDTRGTRVAVRMPLAPK